MSGDRYFDELSSRFASKIYGSTKGAVRLAVLQRDLLEVLPKRPLRVLDIGAGQGHIALWLAQQGHQLTLTEPSAPMLGEAEQAFAESGLDARFIQCPWQDLSQHLASERFDLVLCHAVLEWLAEPLTSLSTLHRFVSDDGWLSLAFYNQDALRYRNLIKGNFRKVSKEHWRGEQGGLTPQQPIDPRLLESALTEAGLAVQARSGIRVFFDYMPKQFQSHASLETYVEQELAHSRHPTFAGLGRYLHWLCQRQ
ncbi:methyltransferase domain-containing protein [Atopomonas hussainii]|uniref:methyltransferase domain-containing protein n=1 Tax=Atopomonas hussainii TaxID=1429083 RepID=UPI0009003191|nr:methyltransferase domain-containing protein [Atopomonas hussainii]